MATNILTLEGVIENGHVRILTEQSLPEGARVFIVIPEMLLQEQARIYSPRLKNPSQITDFQLEVSEDNSNAGI